MCDLCEKQKNIKNKNLYWIICFKMLENIKLLSKYFNSNLLQNVYVKFKIKWFTIIES